MRWRWIRRGRVLHIFQLFQNVPQGPKPPDGEQYVGWEPNGWMPLDHFGNLKRVCGQNDWIIAPTDPSMWCLVQEVNVDLLAQLPSGTDSSSFTFVQSLEVPTKTHYTSILMIVVALYTYQHSRLQKE